MKRSNMLFRFYLFWNLFRPVMMTWILLWGPVPIRLILILLSVMFWFIKVFQVFIGCTIFQEILCQEGRPTYARASILVNRILAKNGPLRIKIRVMLRFGSKARRLQILLILTSMWHTEPIMPNFLIIFQQLFLGNVFITVIYALRC